METQESCQLPKSSGGHRGLLVMGPDGMQVAASGIALQPELADQIVRAWHEARRAQQRLFAVESQDTMPIIVVSFLAADFTVLVAMQQSGRDALFEFVSVVDFAGDILSHFLTNPFQALTVVDRNATVRYLSPVHERFFGLSPGGGVGRHVTEVIENSRLHSVIASGKSEIGVTQEMRGITRVVSRHPIRNTEGELVGAIGQVMFKGPRQLQEFSNEVNKLRSEVAFYQRELSGLRNRSYGLDQMVGTSLAMQRLKQQIVKIAPLDVPVLLTGESGTGKELAAHAIHKLGSRREAQMVTVNAAALPATLVESELFGYEAGAFTGAERKGRKGKIEDSDCGTLFFDEVGDMPSEMQVKLLRVLQDGTFQRVGGSQLRRSDFRLISASNRDFEAMIAEGSFRLDLFYRIGGVTIRLPSLRERVEDIPLLALLALEQFAQRHGQPPKQISSEALMFLQRQQWPGNVRQLMHTVEHAAIFCEGELIGPVDFGFLARAGSRANHEIPVSIEPPGEEAAESEQVSVSSALGKLEERLIREAMAKLQGNKKRVAAALGISRSYLYKRLAQMQFGKAPD